MRKFIKKAIAIFVCFVFVFEQAGFAQSLSRIDFTTHINTLNNQYSYEKFQPAHLRMLSYDRYSQQFSFLVDRGDYNNIEKEFLKQVTDKLFRMFLIGLTLPDDSFWVNLRPDSPEDIIDSNLAKTDMGRIFLEADLQLKKDTARFTSPATKEGNLYWQRLQEKANELFGVPNVNIPTLARPWIVPGEIILRETASDVYIYKATINVMLEEDYIKDYPRFNFKDKRMKELNEHASRLMREIIIPRLVKEVNTAKRYARLRQVFYSLVMAKWFKERFKNSSGRYVRLINQGRLEGLLSKEKWSVKPYFEAYQKSFQEGEYEIKVFGKGGSNKVRVYFSGGALPMPNVIPDPGETIVDSATGTTITSISAQEQIVLEQAPRIIKQDTNVLISEGEDVSINPDAVDEDRRYHADEREKYNRILKWTETADLLKSVWIRALSAMNPERKENLFNTEIELLIDYLQTQNPLGQILNKGNTGDRIVVFQVPGIAREGFGIKDLNDKLGYELNTRLIGVRRQMISELMKEKGLIENDGLIYSTYKEDVFLVSSDIQISPQMLQEIQHELIARIGQILRGQFEFSNALRVNGVKIQQFNNEPLYALGFGIAQITGSLPHERILADINAHQAIVIGENNAGSNYTFSEKDYNKVIFEIDRLRGQLNENSYIFEANEAGELFLSQEVAVALRDNLDWDGLSMQAREQFINEVNFNNARQYFRLIKIQDYIKKWQIDFEKARGRSQQITALTEKLKQKIAQREEKYLVPIDNELLELVVQARDFIETETKLPEFDSEFAFYSRGPPMEKPIFVTLDIKKMGIMNINANEIELQRVSSALQSGEVASLEDIWLSAADSVTENLIETMRIAKDGIIRELGISEDDLTVLMGGDEFTLVFEDNLSDRLEEVLYKVKNQIKDKTGIEARICASTAALEFESEFFNRKDNNYEHLAFAKTILSLEDGIARLKALEKQGIQDFIIIQDEKGNWPDVKSRVESEIKKDKTITRRSFLRTLGLGTLALAGAAFVPESAKAGIRMVLSDVTEEKVSEYEMWANRLAELSGNKQEFIAACNQLQRLIHEEKKLHLYKAYETVIQSSFNRFPRDIQRRIVADTIEYVIFQTVNLKLSEQANAIVLNWLSREENLKFDSKDDYQVQADIASHIILFSSKYTDTLGKVFNGYADGAIKLMNKSVFRYFDTISNQTIQNRLIDFISNLQISESNLDLINEVFASLGRKINVIHDANEYGDWQGEIVKFLASFGNKDRILHLLIAYGGFELYTGTFQTVYKLAEKSIAATGGMINWLKRVDAENLTREQFLLAISSRNKLIDLVRNTNADPQEITGVLINVCDVVKEIIVNKHQDRRSLAYISNAIEQIFRFDNDQVKEYLKDIVLALAKENNLTLVVFSYVVIAKFNDIFEEDIKEFENVEKKFLNLINYLNAPPKTVLINNRLVVLVDYASSAASYLEDLKTLFSTRYRSNYDITYPNKTERDAGIKYKITGQVDGIDIEFHLAENIKGEDFRKALESGRYSMFCTRHHSFEGAEFAGVGSDKVLPQFIGTIGTGQGGENNSMAVVLAEEVAKAVSRDKHNSWQDIRMVIESGLNPQTGKFNNADRRMGLDNFILPDFLANVMSYVLNASWDGLPDAQEVRPVIIFDGGCGGVNRIPEYIPKYNKALGNTDFSRLISLGAAVGGIQGLMSGNLQVSEDIKIEIDSTVGSNYGYGERVPEEEVFEIIKRERDVQEFMLKNHPEVIQQTIDNLGFGFSLGDLARIVISYEASGSNKHVLKIKVFTVTGEEKAFLIAKKIPVKEGFLFEEGEESAQRNLQKTGLVPRLGKVYYLKETDSGFEYHENPPEEGNFETRVAEEFINGFTLAELEFFIEQFLGTKKARETINGLLQSDRGSREYNLYLEKLKSLIQSKGFSKVQTARLIELAQTLVDFDNEYKILSDAAGQLLPVSFITQATNTIFDIFAALNENSYSLEAIWSHDVHWSNIMFEKSTGRLVVVDLGKTTTDSLNKFLLETLYYYGISVEHGKGILENLFVNLNAENRSIVLQTLRPLIEEKAVKNFLLQALRDRIDTTRLNKLDAPAKRISKAIKEFLDSQKSNFDSGGIDFTNISPLALEGRSVAEGFRFDKQDSFLRDMNALINKRIIPSPEGIKEYVQQNSDKENLEDLLDGVYNLLVSVLRLEEEKVVLTDDKTKELLKVIGSTHDLTDLHNHLQDIEFSAKGPEI